MEQGHHRLTICFVSDAGIQSMKFDLFYIGRTQTKLVFLAEC